MNTNLEKVSGKYSTSYCNEIVEELAGSMNPTSMDRQLDRSIMKIQEVFKNGTKEEINYLFELVFENFEFFIMKTISRLFVLNTDTVDMMQEATMCFYDSILKYNIEKGAFIYFSKVYIRRNIYSLIYKSRRHAKNNITFVSVDSFSDEEDKNNYDDYLYYQMVDNVNIEDVIVTREDAGDYLQHMEDLLTEREKKAMYLYLKGTSYEDIATICGITEKSVDNSLHRAKSKLKGLYKKESL